MTEAATSRANLLGYAFGRFVPGAVMLAAIPVLVRVFGTAAYGRYALVYAATLAAASLFTGWIRQAALRFTGTNQQYMTALPRSVLVVAPSAVGIVCAFTSAAAWHGLHAGPALASAAYGLTFAVYTLTSTAAQRDVRVTRYNVAEILRSLLALAIPLPLGGSSFSGGTCILLGGALANLVAIGITAGPSHRVPGREEWRVARSAWTYGGPLSLWLTISAAMTGLDRFVLERHASVAQVGTYVAAAEIAIRGTAMIATPVLLAVHPMVMRSYNAGEHAHTAHVLARWSRNLGVALLLFVVGLTVLGPWALHLMLGHAGPSRATIAALAASGALSQYALLAHKPLEFGHQTRKMLDYAALGLIAQAVLSLLLVGPWGAAGVAVGMLFGSAVYLVLVIAAAVAMGDDVGAAPRVVPLAPLLTSAWLRLRGLLEAPVLARRNRRSSESVTGDGAAVVCLTSYGRRLDAVHLAVESIGRGRVRPRRLLLYVAHDDLTGSLPSELARLVERGLELVRVEDTGSHKKYWDYVAGAPETGLPLVTADDDVVYPRGWLDDLLRAHRRAPGAVWCHRAKRVLLGPDDAPASYRLWPMCGSTEPSLRTVPTGTSGVLYPFPMVEQIAAHGSGFIARAPRADDLWLHHIAVRSGHPAGQVRSTPRHFALLPFGTGQSLWQENHRSGNDEVIAELYRASEWESVRGSRS
ncbi:MAG TPA: lipopolysaccharide biosynthesis protein [Marmoricola sp.]|jgi:O-antigen/teichoic acid export membrane protein|nr:lipopolysaccharide biosynthesis protein [Marmoricola sp.]